MDALHGLNQADHDVAMMRVALSEAKACGERGEVPVGAVVAHGRDVLATAGNAREMRHDPTAHAETLALRQAAAARGSWRLDGCTLYVTLEPCAMCAGAIVLSRIDRVVFGAFDPKAGFVGSLGDLVQDHRLNHRAEVASGVLADECGAVLKDFFKDRR